jgi:HlyD family secretion protein
MGKRKLLIIPVLLAGAAIGYWQLQKRAHSNPGLIRVSGNIEVTDAEVSFKIPGRVVERRVDEGETVRAGQLVARLEDAELARDVALRKAELRAAQAALAELEAGSRPEEIAAAEAAVRKAQAFLDELLAGSRPEEIAAARAAAQKAQEALNELLAGSRPEEIAAAEALAGKAQAALDDLLAGSRPQEVAAAEATLQRAKAEEEHLRTEYARQKALYETGVASSQQHDAAKAAYDVAATKLREAEEHLKLVKEGPRKDQIQQARAALAEAKARLDLVKAGPRKEQIEQARAAVAGANAQLDLVKAGPRKETIEQARAALAAAKAQFDLVRKGPRPETIDQSRARVEQAREAVALAETRRGFATLASPLSGIVLSKSIEPGEFVAAGTPVVTVGDLANVWLRAYINETDLGRVKLGQPARVTTDTYPGKVYPGKVSFIASQAEFTPKNVQTERERVKLVYRVKVDIPNSAMELKPGMPADAEILLGGADEEHPQSQIPDSRQAPIPKPR